MPRFDVVVKEIVYFEPISVEAEDPEAAIEAVRDLVTETNGLELVPEDDTYRIPATDDWLVYDENGIQIDRYDGDGNPIGLNTLDE